MPFDASAALYQTTRTLRSLGVRTSSKRVASASLIGLAVGLNSSFLVSTVAAQPLKNSLPSPEIIAQQQLMRTGQSQVILDMGPAPQAAPAPLIPASSYPQVMVSPNVSRAANAKPRPYYGLDQAGRMVLIQPTMQQAPAGFVPDATVQLNPEQVTKFVAPKSASALGEPLMPDTGGNFVYQSPVFNSKVTATPQGTAPARLETKVVSPARFGDQAPAPGTSVSATVYGQANTMTTPASETLVNSGPLIPASALPTPTSPSPKELDEIAQTTPQGLSLDDSFLDDIPGVEANGGFDENLDGDFVANSSLSDQKWSVGVALNLDTLAAQALDDSDALGSIYGVSLDVGRKLGENFVVRAMGTYDQVDIKASDITSISTDIEGKLYSVGLLGDWHPFKNGFRLSLGPAISVLDLKDNNSSITNTVVSPYIGLGYDSSLFSPSPFSLWADIGAYTYDGYRKANFGISGNLGVKYAF